MKQYSFPLLFHRLAALCVLAMAITIGSCAFGDKEDVVPAVTGDNGQVIYVAGRYAQHACVWTVKGTLPVRLMLARPPAATASRACAIAVDNRQLIVSGTYTVAGVSYPILWKNGMPLVFSTGGNSISYRNGDSLAIAGGNRYYVTAIINNFGALLVNGVPLALAVPSGTTQSMAVSVAIHDPHVLAGGWVTIAAVDHACYWLDGQCTVLDNAGAQSAVYAVQFLDNNVYAAGIINSTEAILWINGVPNRVSPGVSASPFGLHVFEGIPYMAGYINTGTMYAVMWPGQQVLSPTSTSATGLGVFAYSGGMAHGAVIVSGRQDDAGIATAYLWVDGVPVRLDGVGNTDDTEARAAVAGPEVW